MRLNKYGYSAEPVWVNSLHIKVFYIQKGARRKLPAPLFFNKFFIQTGWIMRDKNPRHQLLHLFQLHTTCFFRHHIRQHFRIHL